MFAVKLFYGSPYVQQPFPSVIERWKVENRNFSNFCPEGKRQKVDRNVNFKQTFADIPCTVKPWKLNEHLNSDGRGEIARGERWSDWKWINWISWWEKSCEDMSDSAKYRDLFAAIFAHKSFAWENSSRAELLDYVWLRATYSGNGRKLYRSIMWFALICITTYSPDLTALLARLLSICRARLERHSIRKSTRSGINEQKMWGNSISFQVK